LVAGQEVLTADSVWSQTEPGRDVPVADAAKAAHETQSWQSDLYTMAQLSLRAIRNGIAVEALLNQRLDIGAQVWLACSPRAAKIGVNSSPPR